MLMESLAEQTHALLLICAAAAAMEALAPDGRGAPAFRSVCALAVAVGAVRFAANLLGGG